MKFFDLKIVRLKTFSVDMPEAAALLAPGAAVNRRTSPGGAGPEAVKVQIKEFQIQLDSQRERLKSDI